MKTYRNFMEGKPPYKDAEFKRDVAKMKSKLKRGEVIGFSMAHDELSTFKDEKEFADSSKDKKMKWVRVK